MSFRTPLSRLCGPGLLGYLVLAWWSILPIFAQVAPAPGWCSMGHCNPQMTDFVARTPPGVSGTVSVKTSDEWNSGVSSGDGCVSNGKYVACAYKQSWNAIVVYDGDGHTIWGSGPLLDNHSFSGMPIMQADGSLIAADDQHMYGFNPDGSVAWVTATPGGTPIGLVPTTNGAIVAATSGQQISECWQGNCTLSFILMNGGTGYTTANVILAGGYCPGAAATATISGGAVTTIVATTQGSGCLVAPDVIVLGDGYGASFTSTLVAAAPVSVYSGGPANTGKLLGSTYLYQNGTSGPYYATINTPCVNNASYPNRLYVLAALQNDNTQGALWALDVDPANLASPITPAWNLVIHGPSGASPLCVGDRLYFDGAGITPGDNVGTTVFGVQDNGTSGSFIFQVPLGAGSEDVTCNFALDPRAVGGFWHQLRFDPNIYHRDFNTGNLIETINVSDLLTAMGAPQSTYWQGGIFTTYGSADRPYLLLPEVARPGNLGYMAMLDIAAQQLVWAVPLAGNDYASYDTPGGDAALVLDGNNNPVMVMTGKQSAAYFITGGGPTAVLSRASLNFGSQGVGTTSASQSVSLINSASAILNVGAITSSGPFTQTNTCGATLAPGVSCTITVTFAPTATGPQTGSITVHNNSQSSPQVVALSGAGTSVAPVVSLMPTRLLFPPQSRGTISPAKLVTLTNTGTAALAISKIAGSSVAAQTNGCPTSLAPGASCTINVMLAAPTAGTCSGQVTLTSNFSGGPQSVSVSGTCLDVPAVESALSTSSLVFLPQTVGTAGPSQSIMLLNIGTAALSITSISAGGDATQTNNCGGGLTVGSSCTIRVTFTPGGIGPRNGSITVKDSAPDSPHNVTISGVGQANPVPVVNQPLLPGAVQPGSTAINLTVNGSGFVQGSVVYWNGTPRVTTYVSASQLTATILSTDLASPATGAVSVVNPVPGGGQSNIVWLPVGYPTPTPVLTSCTIPAGGTPTSLASADLNADGNLDLVVANSGVNAVSVLLGHGDGTFAAASSYPTGVQPEAVAVGDLNHDGVPDLAVVNQADNTVSVLLGSGGGVFGATRPYATGNAPVAVAIADLNGDGNLDLAVANSADNTVSVLNGVGDGTFSPHLDYPAGPSPSALVAGDFNGDGRLDLAVANDANPGGSVTVLLNHGDGSYLTGVPYATGDAVALVATDFDGNGILDLAALSYMVQTLSVYLGDGDGTFTLGPTQSTRLAPNPVGLAAADLTGDGNPELITSLNSVAGLMALENDYAATFAPILQYGGVSGAGALTAGDFNNDGSIDVAVVVPGSNSIALVMQTAAATLSSSALSFGSVPVGGSATQNVVITNTGSAVLRTSSVSAGGGATFTQTNNCVSSGAIAPGNSCTVAVSFNPTATGVKNGVLTMRTNTPAGSQGVTLSGYGAVFAVAFSLPVSSSIGGGPVTSNTVTVSSPAPPGGWTVLLSSSNPAVASVPASVTIAPGATASASFDITTAIVAAATPVTITATLNKYGATTTFTVNPYAVSFTLGATGVQGGLQVTSNTLTLGAPAPAGGLTFNLTSTNPAIAGVTPSVTVAAGATVSSPFVITTSGVGSNTGATIFAGLTGLSAPLANTLFAVWAAVPNAVVLAPGSIVAGVSSTGNAVNLLGSAPSAGLTVTLSSSKPAVASVPASVTVPANAAVSQPFTITAGYVSASTQVTITATCGGASATATLTVTPDGVASVNLSPGTVIGGGTPTASNTVTLMAPAPASGASVKMTSSNPSVASVPSAVKMSGGLSTSAGFKITTSAVTASTPVTITATYNGISANATLTVNPLLPVSVNLSQAGVFGGKTVDGSVTLNAAAPPGGITVALSSSNSSIASVPATVTVAAGSLVSPKFTITTRHVITQTVVTITATYQTNSASAQLTVAP